MSSSENNTKNATTIHYQPQFTAYEGNLNEVQVVEKENLRNFYGMSLQDLKDFLKGLGKEQFRAQQIFKWVYEKRVVDYDQMSNLSKSFRDELKGLLDFEMPKVLSHLVSID